MSSPTNSPARKGVPCDYLEALAKRRANRPTGSPAAVSPAIPSASRLLVAQVRQALQQAVACGAISPHRLAT